MAYLLGPGDLGGAEQGETGELGNRHTEPTVVASWDPIRTATWAQQCRTVAWSEPDAAWRALHTLAQGIGDETAAGARLEDTAQPRNLVWHTIMAAHPDDGQLTDDQWQAIAARLMHQTGLHPDGSDNPVRWVAVRHGPNAAGADHIHVMAVLVRLDGTRASIHNDVFAAQGAARWAEQEHGLTPGRGPHLTGRPSPRRARRPASQPLRHGRRDQDRTALPQAPGHGQAHLGAGAAGRPEPDVDPAGPHPSRRTLSRRPGHLRPAPHRPRRGSGLPGPAALLAHQPRADHRLERRRPTRPTGPHPQSVRRAHPRVGLHLARADRAHQRPRPVRRAGHHPWSGRTGDDRPSPDGRRRLGRAVHRPGHRQ